jgi:hypothetical protein
MESQTACDALRERKRLQLRYNGLSRVVEVHAVGTTRAGHAVMRAYQVRGGSLSNNPVGWKLMRLDEALAAEIIDEPSAAPRAGYKRGDKAMTTIGCQI